MRKIAYVSLSALAIVGTMTSQAWAPKVGALTPNVGALTPNIGALTPNVGALTPNIGALTPNVGALTPNAGALTPPTKIPNVPSPNYGQLPNPAKVPIYDAANAPLGGFDPPTLNYGNLAPEGPRLNYGALQPEAPNAAMGKLPPAYDVVPAQPAVKYGVLPPNAPVGQLPNNPAAALPNRPQLNYGALTPEAPNAPMGRLPDRPLPLAYGELPSAPAGLPKKLDPAKDLAKAVGLPDNHPGIAAALDNTVTKNVGVPNPPGRTPVVNMQPLPPPKPLRNLQNLPPPRAAAANPPAAPPAGYWSRLTTAQKRVIVGTGAIVTTTIVLTAVGISMPAIIEKITGDEIADTGNADFDALIDKLTENP